MNFDTVEQQKEKGKEYKFLHKRRCNMSDSKNILITRAGREKMLKNMKHMKTGKNREKKRECFVCSIINSH